MSARMAILLDSIVLRTNATSRTDTQTLLRNVINSNMQKKTENYGNTQLIFNSFLARQLLHLGNPIKDIVKHHGMNNSVVFVFEKTEKFKNDYSVLQKQYR